MEHLTDKQLLELLEQFGDQLDRLDDGPMAHLDQCDRCMQRWLDLQASWDALGAWTVDMPQSDLSDRIVSRAVSTSIIHLRQPKVWLRIAASVIIGVGVGALMGRIGPKTVSAEEASQAIYLDALALNSSTGWTAPMLGESQE